MSNLKPQNMKEKDLDKRFEELRSENSSGNTDEELSELKEIHDLLMDHNGPDPPSSMDTGFYSMLDNEIQKTSGNKYLSQLLSVTGTNVFRYSVRIAAGIALFIMGWFGSSFMGESGNNSRQLSELSTEINSLKESLVLTMMKQSSPADRIQAVTMVSGLEEIDTRIAGSLLGVLTLDPNDNVRLVALETLIGYTDNPEVREGLIRSISVQKSPLIQLRLAEVMLMLEEKRSAGEFQKILTDVTLDYNVREKLNQAVEVLL